MQFIFITFLVAIWDINKKKSVCVFIYKIFKLLQLFSIYPIAPSAVGEGFTNVVTCGEQILEAGVSGEAFPLSLAESIFFALLLRLRRYSESNE